LPQELDGLRIVQLSDIHVGPTVRREFVERIVGMVNDLAPDIVAITGDLVDANVADLKDQVAPLTRIVSRLGTFFVTGNHEFHADAEGWCAHLPTLGIRVLRNERVDVLKNGHVLQIAGVDDYEANRFGGMPDIAKALRGRDERSPLILLAHHPKAILEAMHLSVDLQLSGHTHGGQVWPLGWLLRVQEPLIAGLAKFDETFLYVSSGTGYSGPPMRLGAPAEITEIVLRADRTAAR